MKPSYDELEQQLRRIGDAAKSLDGLMTVAAEISRGNDIVRRIDSAHESAAVAPDLPVVIVEISGGAIKLARSSAPMRVVVLDSDTEGGDGDNVIEVDGEDVYLTSMVLDVGADPGFGGVSPQVVAAMLEQIDRPVDAESASAPTTGAPRA